MIRILSYSPHLADHLHIRESLKHLHINSEQIHIDSIFNLEIIPDYIAKAQENYAPIHLIIYAPKISSIILEILPSTLPIICLSGKEDADSLAPQSKEWVYYPTNESSDSFLNLVTKCLEIQKIRYELCENHSADMPSHLSQSQFLEIIGDHLNRAFILESTVGMCLFNLETYENDPFNRHRVTQIIRKLYKTVKETLPPKWSLYSYGSMRIALIIDDISDKEIFSKHLIELYQKVSSYFVDQNLVVSIDAGVILSESTSVDPFQFYDQAQSALAIAKRKGHGFIEYYGKEEESKFLYATKLESDLKQAFIKKELYVVYQPLINLTTLKPVGIEALVRWTHPLLGPISPMDFIPIAERLNAMDDLAEIVFDQSFATLKELHNLGILLKLSVNISGQQFINSSVVDKISHKLAIFDINAESIEIEVTEEVDLNPIAPALPQLHELQNMGCSIVIDDFGIGYSSLHYLSHFPVDKIKIDKSFIQDLTERKVKILEAVHNLAKFLGIETLVEGIETKEQYEMLKFIGAGYGQGYLFSRPLTKEQLLTYLHQIT